jgi:DNA repair protein RadA/Sms
VNRLEQRIIEAEKLGMNKIFIPEYGKALNLKKFHIPIEPVSRVDEFFKKLFGKR